MGFDSPSIVYLKEICAGEEFYNGKLFRRRGEIGPFAIVGAKGVLSNLFLVLLFATHSKYSLRPRKHTNAKHKAPTIVKFHKLKA